MKLNISHKVYQNSLLSLLIVSGTLKVFLSYYSYPFDITIQILFLITIDIFYSNVFNKKIRFNKIEVFYVFTLLIFCLIATISLVYTPSHYLGSKKLFLMLIPVIGFVYVKFIDEIDLKILYKALLYIIIPLSIWFVAFKYFLYNNAPFFDFRTDRTLFMPLRNSYLNFGYILGVLSILSIKYSKNPFLIILVCSILILALGSRGALLFLMISLFIVYFKELVLFFKNLKIKKRILRFILFSFVPFVCLLLIYYDKLKGAIEYGLIRFTSLLNASSDKSLLGRIDQYYYVIKEGFKPQGLTIGYGLGSFGLNYTHEEKLAYPHNIFLEAWYELGFFAMCLLIVLFVFPFFHLKREQVLKTLALFAFFNAMKTLSFSTDRNLFILFGILIFHKEICQKIYKSY